jgi:hypothetical protein
LALVRELYPHTPTFALAKKLGRSITTVYQMALKLGLHKSAAYLASPAACRLRRGDNIGAQSRFPKGHVPANKGLRRPGYAPGRMKETQFQKGVRQGVAVRLYKPVGTERISKDGYLERKANDDMPLQSRWRAVHLIEWEKANGPLPKGYAICFVNGDKTDRRLDNYGLISRGDLSPALKRTIVTLGSLKRRIRREEQNRGSTESPVRNARRPARQRATAGH